VHIRSMASASFLVSLLAAGGCGDSPAIDDDTRARVIALGDPAAMSLVRTLGTRLNAVVAQRGPAGAVEFCAGEALSLTDSVSDALGEEWQVKRTTLRTRNPRNAPDSMEAEALEHFHAAMEAGREPGSWVQRTPDGDFRYYMPLFIGPMCLQCHGEGRELDPAVREVLRRRYPSDEATGYTDRDLRGAIRVTVPRSAVD
jgi:hypothetical protein